MDTKEKQKENEEKSHDDKKTKFSKLLLLAALTGNIISIVASITYSWTSPVVPKLKKDNSENPLDHILTKAELSWITGTASFGTTLAPIIGGIASKKFGRKLILLATSIPLSISMFTLAFSTTVVGICIGRFFSGISLGIVYTILPIYLGEIAEKQNRGFMGCLISVTIGLGLLLCYAIGPYLSIMVFSLLPLILMAVFLISFGFIALESPIYLAYVGKFDKSKENLCKFRNHLSKNDIDKEFLEITELIKENEKRISVKDFFASKGLVKTLLLGMGIHSLQQLSGFSVTLTLMHSIFDESGSSISSNLSADIVASVHVLSVFITAVVIERLGRKLLLLTSCITTAIALLTFGTYYFLKEDGHDVSNLYWLPVTCLVIFEITYHIGLGPIPHLLLGELFPSHSKALAVACCSCFSHLIGFGISFAFPSFSGEFGLGITFWIFGGFTLLGFVFIAIFFIDTKGKTLFEIQKLYNQ